MTLYAWQDDGLRILDEPSEPDVSGGRQRRLGGTNWGAGFFGWLAAVAVAGLLFAALAVVLVTLDRLGVRPGRDAAFVSVTARVFGLVGLLVAYYAGGYVAGRMSRFNGGLQGFAVWIVGLLPTTAALGLGLELTPVHDLMARWAAPASQPGEGIVLRDLAVAVVVVVGPLLAAVVGGRVGCRYQRKLDLLIDLAARLRRR